MYHQPPFYKELRGYDGLLNLNIEAQKSIHYVVSNEYNFDMWNRQQKQDKEALSIGVVEEEAGLGELEGKKR